MNVDAVGAAVGTLSLTACFVSLAVLLYAGREGRTREMWIGAASLPILVIAGGVALVVFGSVDLDTDRGQAPVPVAQVAHLACVEACDLGALCDEVCTCFSTKRQGDLARDGGEDAVRRVMAEHEHPDWAVCRARAQEASE